MFFFDSHEQAAFVPRMGTDYTYFSGMNLNRRFCMMAKRRQTWIRGWREKNAEGIHGRMDGQKTNGQNNKHSWEEGGWEAPKL